jgi:hypothetical protein
MRGAIDAGNTFMEPVRRWDIRTFAIIAFAAAIGAAWAGYNLWLVGDARDPQVFRALIWIVFATPFATFWGWVIARPAERWWAAFVCFCIYFFAIFAGARVERLILGEAAANSSGHALYFQLTLAFDIVCALVVALHRARALGTIPSPNNGAAHT